MAPCPGYQGDSGLAKKRADGSAQARGASVTAAKVPLAAAGAAVLRQQYDKMRATEAGTRQGDDIEALHQMRVATRRLRAALRIFVADDLRSTFLSIEADVRAIASALGAVRDLDVFGEELRARAEGAPEESVAIGTLLESLERVRTHRREELRAVLDGPAARRFWEAFPVAVDELERSADDGDTVRKVAPRVIAARLSKVIKAGDRLSAPTSTELHEFRIACKRLRYACEFFKPWLAGRLDPIIQAATGIQDTLGALHDGDVTPDTLLDLVGAPGDSGSPRGATSNELERMLLRMMRDRLAKRDELLVRFRDQWADLRALGGSIKLKTT